MRIARLEHVFLIRVEGSCRRTRKLNIPTSPCEVRICKDEFVKWCEDQHDGCACCGLRFDELRRLKIKRGAGYYVSWDIDRVDSARPYKLGNIALSCFVCNMGKGSSVFIIKNLLRTAGVTGERCFELLQKC